MPRKQNGESATGGLTAKFSEYATLSSINRFLVSLQPCDAYRNCSRNRTSVLGNFVTAPIMPCLKEVSGMEISTCAWTLNDDYEITKYLLPTRHACNMCICLNGIIKFLRLNYLHNL